MDDIMKPRYALLFVLLLVVALGCPKRTTAPIHDAAQTGDIDEVETLIREGSDVDAISTDEQADAALHRAVGAGNIDVAKTLIRAGADVNIRTGRFGWTPLHIAATKGNNAMVKLLIESGADINVLDGNGYSPLDYAIAKGKPDTAELLRAYGAVSGGEK